MSSLGSGCGEVGVWATEGEVQWPGIEGDSSVLGLFGSLRAWERGPVLQKSHPAGGQVGAQKCLILGGLAEGCHASPRPVNWDSGSAQA